ncbi:MAG: NAD(P)H-dependent oxidoreductase [Pseudomonadota bacterium]
MKVIHYFAHPGQSTSRVNRAMWAASSRISGITAVDLYSEYPRYDIDINREQARLLAHDLILLQFPFFWYSCPALLKEWIDLVLEHGFAYGKGGDKLAGKTLMLAISAGGPEEAYSKDGYQNHELRTFLTPFEQTARLCRMSFLAPYVLYGSLTEPEDDHARGFVTLIEALRDDQFDLTSAKAAEVLTHTSLPILQRA